MDKSPTTTTLDTINLRILFAASKNFFEIFENNFNDITCRER